LSFLFRFSISHFFHFVLHAPPIILNLITQIIFCEAYRLRSYLLCSLFQPPSTSSLSAPCSRSSVIVKD
jgi:hypothetical protein